MIKKDKVVYAWLVQCQRAEGGSTMLISWLPRAFSIAKPIATPHSKNPSEKPSETLLKALPQNPPQDLLRTLLSPNARILNKKQFRLRNFQSRLKTSISLGEFTLDV